MSGLVVDASMALAWIFNDEDQSRVEAALERLKEDGAVVPQLWLLEIRNALLSAGRRGRISPEEIGERLDALNGLPIQTDGDPNYPSAFDLARKHGLSFYDALYLELAKRQGAELATLDRALAHAAASEGVPLWVA